MGIVKDRSTTDILLLILILMMWGAMSYVGYVGVTKGNISRLIAPTDSAGLVCGFDSEVKHLKYLYTVTASGYGKCTSSCPKDTHKSFTSNNPLDYICLDWVYGFFSPPYDNTNTLFKTYITNTCFKAGVFNPAGSKVPSDNLCGCNLIMNTTSIFNRCVFEDSSVRQNYVNQHVPNYFTGFMEDIVAARLVIFCFGFLVSIALSFLYVQLMRFETLALCSIWSCIAMILALMITFITLCVVTYRKWGKEDPPIHSNLSRIALVVVASIFTFLAIILVFVSISLRKSISVAVKVMSISAEVLTSMPLIVFTPLIHVTGLLVFMVPFLYYILGIASSGTFEDTYAACNGVPPTCNGIPSGVTQIKTGRSYKLNADNAQEQLWYLFFCFLWTMNFIASAGSMVIAISTAKWYFTPPEERNSITSTTVFTSYGTFLRYHIGSVAFGSLIIAIVQFIRSVLLYIERQVKQLHDSTIGKSSILNHLQRHIYPLQKMIVKLTVPTFNLFFFINITL